MEIKVGDIVICKKNFKSTGYKIEKIRRKEFIKGQEYIITYSDHWAGTDSVIIYQINYKVFCFVNSDSSTIFPYIYDYFYSKQELRKMKLNKLQNE